MRRLPAVLGLFLLAAVTGCGDGPSDPSRSLVGRWQLDTFLTPDGRPLAVPAPERFTIGFDQAGRVSIRADCNTCTGTYQSDGVSLTIGPQLACTRAACSLAPLDEQYVAALAGATSYEIRGDRLTIFSSGGILTFSRLE